VANYSLSDSNTIFLIALGSPIFSQTDGLRTSVIGGKCDRNKNKCSWTTSCSNYFRAHVIRFKPKYLKVYKHLSQISYSRCHVSIWPSCLCIQILLYIFSRSILYIFSTWQGTKWVPQIISFKVWLELSCHFPNFCWTNRLVYCQREQLLLCFSRSFASPAS